MTDELQALAERVEALTGHDNAVDVLCEVAMFEPIGVWKSVKANSAGTKVIYTDDLGNQTTYWADNWTDADARQATAAALRARASKEPEA